MLLQRKQLGLKMKKSRRKSGQKTQIWLAPSTPKWKKSKKSKELAIKMAKWLILFFLDQEQRAQKNPARNPRLQKETPGNQWAALQGTRESQNIQSDFEKTKASQAQP